MTRLRTAADAVAWFLACKDCGGEHECRRIEVAPHRVTWADPDDEHSYRPRDQSAGTMLRLALEAGAV